MHMMSALELVDPRSLNLGLLSGRAFSPRGIRLQRELLESFGQLLPVVVTCCDEVLIGGDIVLAALQADLDVIVYRLKQPSGDPEVIKAGMVASRADDLRLWDHNQLLNNLQTLDDCGVPSVDVGFTTDEVTALIEVVDTITLAQPDTAGFQQARADALPDIESPLKLTPVVKVGALYQKRDDKFCPDWLRCIRGTAARVVWMQFMGMEGMRHEEHCAYKDLAQWVGLSFDVRVIEGTEPCDWPGEVDEDTWGYIRQNLCSLDTLDHVRPQVANLKGIEFRHLVVTVGKSNGCILAGILHGLVDQQLTNHVVAIAQGRDPTAVLEDYAPDGWQQQVTLVTEYAPQDGDCIWIGGE